MRVLLACHKPAFPTVDGGTFDSAGLARSLAEAGHEVRLLAMAGSAWREPDAPPPFPQEVVRVDSSPKPLPALLSLLRGEADAVARYRSAAFARRLEERLRAEAFDVVQIDGAATGQYLPAIRAASAARVVLRAHNDEADLWHQRSLGRPFLERRFIETHARRLRAIERRLWLEVDGIAAITADLATACVAGGVRHVACVPVPQQVAESPAASNHNAFHIGPLDWWANRQGLSWFLESVWPRIREARPGFEFRVAGRGSAEFTAPWRSAGVTGEGEVKDAADYMRRGGILVAPTLQGSGMPVKVAQGLSLGKAIVATTIGARGLGVSASRDLLIADEPGAFATAVCRLSGDPELVQSLGRAGLAFARAHLDARVVAERLGSLYDAVRSPR
jgi:glycosyltransferase involved in cell wall biosynthesis